MIVLKRSFARLMFWPDWFLKLLAQVHRPLTRGQLEYHPERSSKRGRVALAALQAPTLASSSVVRWTQEAVITTFRKLFPADWFLGFRFPMIEDLLNQHPLLQLCAMA